MCPCPPSVCTLLGPVLPLSHTPLLLSLRRYVQRDMSTTTKATIRNPDSHPAFVVTRARPSGPRFGMVTEETFDEAMLA